MGITFKNSLLEIPLFAIFQPQPSRFCSAGVRLGHFVLLCQVPPCRWTGFLKEETVCHFKEPYLGK
jgi:hypothetical protein